LARLENIFGNIRNPQGVGLSGVTVTLKDFETQAVVDKTHSVEDGYWEFIEPGTGKYNIIFRGRNTTIDDNIFGHEIVDMSEFEDTEQFRNDTPPAGIFSAGAAPIAHVTNRLEAVAQVQWVYTPNATDKHHGFVVRWEHGPSSGQAISATSPSRKIDSTARDFAIQIPADDYITIKVYAYYIGVSGTNEDSGYQHANWVDSRATALATLSGWDSNPTSLSKNNAILHSDGYLVLGTGDDVVRVDATHATYREWIGHATIPTLAAYAVEKTGVLHAAGAIIEGDITASSGSILGTLYVGATSSRIVIDGAAKTIGMEDFVSGVTGWQIDGAGNAEINNVVARGVFAAETLLLQEAAITRGTQLIVTSGAELFEPAVTTGSGTFTLKVTVPPSGGNPLGATSICVLDNGTNEVWFTPGAGVLTGGTHYVYTATWLDGASHTFGIGTAIADYGASGAGGLLLTADRANAPYMDVFTHSGDPYTTLNTHVRIGDLTGIVDTDFGISPSGFGLYTDNVYLKGSVVTSTGAGQRITINEYVGAAFNNAFLFYDSGNNVVLIIDDNIDVSLPGIGMPLGGTVVIGDGAGNDTIVSHRQISIQNISNTTRLIQSNHSYEADNDGTAVWAIIIDESVNTHARQRTAISGESQISQAANDSIPIGVYGTATTANGAIAAYAGYFDDGDVYIKEKLAIGKLIPVATLDVVGTFAVTGLASGITPVSDGDFAIKSYVDDLVIPVDYVPNNINVATGTTDAGNVASLQTLDDGDSLDISEVTGVPGYNIEINYASVTEIPTRLDLHVYYDGSLSHTVNVQIYDQVGMGWDTLGTIPDDGIDFIYYTYAITNGAKYIKGDNTVETRIYHATSGNVTHNIFIDYAAIRKIPIGGGGGVTDHSGLSGLGDNDHPQYLLVADIDDTPVNGETAQPISSNWAYDHDVADDHITHAGVSIIAGAGLSGGGNISASRTINIGAGSGILVSPDFIAVDVTDFMANGSINRIVTSTGATAMNAEANLTFDGSTLDVTGDITVSGTVDGVDIAGRDHARYADAEAIAAVEGEATLALTGLVTNANHPSFFAWKNANQNDIAKDSEVTVTWPSELFDRGNDFASNTFTAPVAGLYYFTVSLRLENLDSGAAYYLLRFVTSVGGNYDTGLIDPNFTADLNYFNFIASAFIPLTFEETVHVTIYQSSGTQQTDIGGSATGSKKSFFSGFLVA